MTNEQDIELLEMYLDGALDPSQQAALKQRLEGDSALVQELTRLETARKQRLAVWESFEAPAGTDLADRVLATIETRSAHRAWFYRILDYREQIATAAACIAVFLIGWQWGHSSGAYRMIQTGTSPTQPVGLITQQQIPAGAGMIWEVKVNDGAGNTVQVQRFNTLEEAQQFIQQMRTKLLHTDQQPR